MKLAAEKNLNRHSFPVIATKGKPLCHNQVFKQGNSQFLCEAGTYGPKQMMVLDLLATHIIHGTYNLPGKPEIDFADRIPTSNDKRVQNKSRLCMTKTLISHLVDHIYLYPEQKDIIPEHYYQDARLASIDGEYGRMKKIQTIWINDRELKKKLPIFKQYSSNEIYEMIKRTAECKIRMNYPIRCFDNGAFINIENKIFRIPSSFFRLIEVKNLKLSADNHILEREYEIRFDTILGYLFIQNAISCYTDLLPLKFYNLTDYAQLFYRLLILPYYKQVKNPIGLKEIKNRLVLKTYDTYMVRQTIKRILDELEANSFIKEPKEIKQNGEYFYGYVKTAWKEI
jgi:hypothetical protein